MNETIAERFARDIAAHEWDTPSGRKHARGHEMTVLHEDGLYRHLRFASPDRREYWFELITVPDALIYRGDADSYVFSGATDMLDFFRASSYGEINPQYWAQKLTTPGGRNAVTMYDVDLFERTVKEHVAEAIRGGDTPRGLGRAVTEMLRNGETSWEDGARAELERFEHGATRKLSCQCRARIELPDEDYLAAWAWRAQHRGAGHIVDETRTAGWQFHDTYEWSFRDYDWWFLWACTAIIWGIGRYDESRKTATEPVLVAGGAS